MDTVTANLVLFFFLLTMRRSSLYLPIASLVNVQKMIKKKEMDFGKVNTSIFPEDAKPSLTKKLALI